MLQRLNDLRQSFRVYALCSPCGRMESVDLDAVLARLGASTTVADLRTRVRCRHCGQRSRDIRIVYVGPEGRPADFHYRR
jgi:hypothetical protein